MDYSPGLRGVIAGETEISTVGMEGTSLRYRGYDAIELTRSHTYGDVASLIIDDILDGGSFKKSFANHYISLLKDSELIELINRLKIEQHPMDVLRTAISYIGEADESNKLDAASKLTAIACLAIASYNLEPSDNLDEEFVVASALLPNNSSLQQLEALDDMLILYAEHGFNASTFAARVTASTRSDLTSSIVSGVGTLKGELHGGANEAAVELINSFNTVEDADKGVHQLLEEKKKITLSLIETFNKASQVALDLRKAGLQKEIKPDNTPVSNGDIEVNKILKLLSIDSKKFFEGINDQIVKEKLKELTSNAFEKELFGAPTFVANNKIFWGQDRLEYAIEELNLIK